MAYELTTPADLLAVQSALGLNLGAWTAYTPTITSGSGAVTSASITASARYQQIGKTIHWKALIAIANVGSGTPGGAINFSLPATSQASVQTPLAAINNANGAAMAGYINLSSTVASLVKSDGTTAWAAGTYWVGGTYEAV